MPKYGIFDFIWGGGVIYEHTSNRYPVAQAFLHKIHQVKSISTTSFIAKLQKSLEPNCAQLLVLNPFKSKTN